MTRTRNAAPAEPEETTAVEVYDPTKAAREIKVQVERRREQFASLLSVDAGTARGAAMLDRFVTVALHAITSNADLLRCTPESLVESVRQSAVLGLEPTGALGEGAIVVYNIDVREEVPSRSGHGMVVVNRKVPTAQFQPMYRGLLKLARRSDQLTVVDANVVYGGDLFEIEQGTDPSIRHVPWPTSGKPNRGEPVGAYAFAKLRTGTTIIEWMTVADIEMVRKSSRATRADSPWVKFWSEMARKSVLRRLMKRLPLESAAEHAVRLETEAESLAAIPDVVGRESAETAAAPRARLLARLNPEAVEEETADVDPPVSVDPGASDRPEEGPDGDENTRLRREGAGEPVEEAAVRSADDLCGKPSPYAEGESCVLEPHAEGPHDDGKRGTWL